MNWKSLVVLVLLAAGLGGFYYYDTYRLAPAREKAESAKGRLWQVEPKDIEALTLKRKADTVKLKRAGDAGWEMLEPVKTRGDRSTVDGLVTTLATIRVDREIDSDPGKLGEFGIEPPEAQVTLEVKGRSEPLVLLVGGKSPTGAWVYGKQASKPAVLALSEIVGRDVARPVADLRDKTVLSFERQKLTAVELEVAGDRMTVEARDAGQWQITKPRALKADADLMADFLDKLGGARAKEFVDEAPKSLRPYGLDRPATVTLWLGKDKERSSRTLLLGRQDKDKKGVYVMRQGEPGVLLVGEELWTAVPKTVGVLRDKVVVAYAYDKVAKVSLEHAGDRVTIEREGSQWKLTSPEPLKADPGAVNSLLWRIRDLRASGFLAEEAKEIPRYLARPDVTVRLWEDGAKEPKVLLLAASREVRGGRPAAVAAVAGQGPVMLVEGKVLEDLARTSSDLRDKSLLPAFELADVKRARVAGGGKSLLVERKGEGEWKALEPSKGAAKEARVSDLLLALKALRWKEIASAKGDDAARYGLGRPELEVTLSGASGAEIATLLLGKEEGERTYARVKTSPVIYVIDSKLARDLRKAPSDIPG
ncbi:MAG: DUF4340 domain-containing protein [Candidatus Rokubacteria bacterium]|nr:DUF4340 domain-containing protein [Candidatus Rokubacteria bacterium]